MRNFTLIALLLIITVAFADDSVDNPRFDIARFDLDGNTLLTPEEIAMAVAAFVGQGQDFGSVQKALEAIENLYRSKGYLLVQVTLPEQKLDQGVVRFNIVETKIGKVSVTGNKFHNDANIRRSVPSVTENNVPNMDAITSDLKVANENPSKKANVLLQNAENGLVDAVVQVTDDKPWVGAISIDNTGDLQTGRNRVSALYQNSNIGGRDHVLSMQYITSVSQPNNVSLIGAGYHIPFYSLGDSLDIYGSYSNVNSGTITAGVFDFGVSGSGKIGGARYTHNFKKMGNYNSSLGAEFDYKALSDNILLFGTQLAGDVTLHPISAVYNGAYAADNTTLNFYFSAARNIPGGNKGTQAYFDQLRAEAIENYSVFRFGGNYVRSFQKDWQARVAMSGQYTANALVPGEQFGAGGAGSVRGFLEREVSNDKGISINLEGYTPNLCNADTQCRMLAFYDTAHLSRNDPQIGDEVSRTISSVGVGFRLTRTPHWAVLADVAHVLRGSLITPDGSNRAHFKVVMTF